MRPQTDPTAFQTPPANRAWTALLLLTTGFTLSQAFRTVAAIMAAPLQAEFHLTPQQLGLFAAAFHFAFGALQLFMGIGLDVHGLRRTVLTVSPLMVLGAAVSALAPSFPVLVAGQVLIGVGCAPAFLVCTVYIARRFAPERFAAVSGAILAIGSTGMLLTGTPLAWLIEASSWRMGFWVLGACAAAAWLAIALGVPEPPAAAHGPRESLGQAVRAFGQLFRLPHTLGIILFSLVTYASFVALRGLWLGPLMMQRYGWSLVSAGNLAMAASVMALIGPPLFGRADPGPHGRRRWLVGFTLLVAALFAGLALGPGAPVAVALMLLMSALSGYMALQYPDVKDAYPPAVMGRAMALFTMATFMGVALMQWLTGAIASAAQAHGVDPFAAVFGSIAALLAAGALAFRGLPQPASVTGSAR
ncbi:MFS transporter [Ottowia sp.]|uniref:MFS transporter n=1 Tax=Ottowia sp. TaxID=1898956 RepID=UPI0039E726D9